MNDLGSYIEPLLAPPAHSQEPHWEHSLSRGAPGIMLLHIEATRTGLSDPKDVHAWASATMRKPVRANPGNGLFHGAPAIAFALHVAHQPGYSDALRSLDQAIARLTHHRLQQAHARMERAELPALGEYDLISGLTGIGCYLLQRHPDGTEVRMILSYLVDLTQPLNIAGETLPGWWTHSGPSRQSATTFPGGHGNLGMAHGITGPLALLSVAMKRGITVPGHIEAIDRICAFLDAWRQDGEVGGWWPPWITRAEFRNGQCAHKGPFRPSWCYGTPGQARAQQLAGQAIGDEERQRTAVQVLTTCIEDPKQLSQLSDATLCHGWAGLLQAVWRTATDANLPELTKALPRLREQVEEAMHGGTESGLLEGQAGQLLTLLTTGNDTPSHVDWDACLLIKE